jgi:hypothetical protein
VHFELQSPSKVPFYVVSNGARALAVHTEADLARSWQTRSMASDRQAFEAAANVVQYLTAKGSLRHRGTSNWPEAVKDLPEDAPSVKIARLKFDGADNPEPLALERFGRRMARDYDVRVHVTDMIAIDKLQARHTPLAMISGTGRLELTRGQLGILHAYVKDGGTLLIEAVGGDEKFGRSAQRLLENYFGRNTLGELPLFGPLYRLKGIEIGKVDLRKRRRKLLKRGAAPRLRGIFFKERAGIIFSPEDISEGLLGCPVFDCEGYAPESAFRIMRNIVLHAGEVRKYRVPE